MSFENTQESGVENVQESSAPAQAESPAPAQTESQGQEASGQDKLAPFHEHPRFKEVIEQNRSYKQELEAIRTSSQEQLMRMQLQLENLHKASQPKQEAESYDDLWQRLNGIDPKFAKLLKETNDRASKYDTISKEVEDLRNWRNQYTQTQQSQTVDTQFKSLHSQYKVPDGMQKRYEAEVRAWAMNNPKAQLSDLPNAYRAIHEDYSKFIDEIKRSERASYVQSKKQDATPATQTGGTPAGPRVEPMSREAAIKNIAAELRRSKSTI